MLRCIVAHRSHQLRARTLSGALGLPCTEFDDDPNSQVSDTMDLRRGGEKIASSRCPCLFFGEEGCTLIWYEGKQCLHLKVDFLQGANAHRRIYGGGKGQAIAKAVGVNTKYKPSVLDCTAGQGKDAFVLAGLGCSVTMIERAPVAHALLSDALSRARAFAARDVDVNLKEVFARMRLIDADSIAYLRRLVSDGGHLDPLDIPDVIYLDPMFPSKKKSAAVKKEMRVFHRLIGADEDADLMLPLAIKSARYRVVVKRSRLAPPLAGAEPNYTLSGKSTRFDIYALSSIPGSS